MAVAGLSESEVLALAASVARGLEPSLAAAILASARGDIEAGVVEQIPQTHRAGAIASINGQTVIVGESGLFAHLGVSLENVGDWPDRSQRQNQRILFVAVNGQTTGFLGTYGSREVIL